MQRDRGVVEVAGLERRDRASPADVEDEVHRRDRGGAGPVALVALQRDLRVGRQPRPSSRHSRPHRLRSAAPVAPRRRRHDAEDRRGDDRREVRARSLEVDLDVEPLARSPTDAGSRRLAGQVGARALNVDQQRDERRGMRRDRGAAASSRRRPAAVSGVPSENVRSGPQVERRRAGRPRRRPSSRRAPAGAGASVVGGERLVQLGGDRGGRRVALRRGVGPLGGWTRIRSVVPLHRAGRSTARLAAGRRERRPRDGKERGPARLRPRRVAAGMTPMRAAKVSGAPPVEGLDGRRHALQRDRGGARSGSGCGCGPTPRSRCPPARAAARTRTPTDAWREYVGRSRAQSAALPAGRLHITRSEWSRPEGIGRAFALRIAGGSSAAPRGPDGDNEASGPTVGPNLADP